MKIWLLAQNSNKSWSWSSKKSNQHHCPVICLLQQPCSSSLPIQLSQSNQRRLTLRQNMIANGRSSSSQTILRKTYRNFLPLRKVKMKRIENKPVLLQERTDLLRLQENKNRWRQSSLSHNQRNHQLQMPLQMMHLLKKRTMLSCLIQMNSRNKRSQETRPRRRRTRESCTRRWRVR